MKAYLTSSPYTQRQTLYKRNGFLKNLKADWKINSKFVYVASFPDSYEITENYAAKHQKAFLDAGLSIGKFTILDRRNQQKAEVLIKEADVIYLSGGHCPTEMKWFKQIKLKKLLKGYEGILIGCSAGTMNSQKIVYAQPEEEGEAIDPNYVRYYEGLGYTDMMILPHYYEYKNHILDGLRVYEDITYSDSMGKIFHIFPDGTYLYIKDDKQTIYGECFVCQDGKFKKLQGNGETYSYK